MTNKSIQIRIQIRVGEQHERSCSIDEYSETTRPSKKKAIQLTFCYWTRVRIHLSARNSLREFNNQTVDKANKNCDKLF